MTFMIDELKRALKIARNEKEKILNRRPMYDDIVDRCQVISNIEETIVDGQRPNDELPVTVYIEINAKTIKDVMESLELAVAMIKHGNTSVRIDNDKVEFVAIGPGLAEPEDPCHG